jgi:hypothetical protein
MKKITASTLLAIALFAALPARAEDSPSWDKIDRIMIRQDQILKELAEIKEELRIIKVRVSSGG